MGTEALGQFAIGHNDGVTDTFATGLAVLRVFRSVLHDGVGCTVVAMNGRDTRRAMTAAMWVSIAACCSVAADADDTGFVPSAPSSQFMLYVSRSIGARTSGLKTFGVRFERAAPGSGDPAARFCAPLRHRALIDLQWARGQSPRMLFGPRVTWDIGRGQLEPTNLATTVWAMSGAPVTSSMLASWVP